MKDVGVLVVVFMELLEDGLLYFEWMSDVI